MAKIADQPPACILVINKHDGLSHFAFEETPSAVVGPGIEHVLQGWGEGGGFARHDVKVADLRVRNVPTRVRTKAVGSRSSGGRSAPWCCGSR